MHGDQPVRSIADNLRHPETVTMRAAQSRSGVVHVVQRMAPGGIETLVLDLVRSGGKDDRIVSLEGTPDGLVAAWGALATVRDRLEAFAAEPGLKPMLVLRLAERLFKLKPAAVVLHHIGPLVYGAAAARLAGVPAIVHVEHDVWHYGGPRRRLIARLVEQALRPHNAAAPEHAARKIRPFLHGAAVTVIPNGIDIDRFRPGDKAEARRRFGLDPSWRIVGTAGRLVPVKGHEVLIAAATFLPGDCHVVIAGDGPEMVNLKCLAIERRIENRVHFLGHVDKVETVLPAFDVFCLPSHAEGSPRSIIEAQAVGLPVVATDGGAPAQAVCPGAGRIVPPADPAAMAHGLREVLALPAGDAPRKFVESRFTWTQTLSSYRKVTEAAHAA